MQERQTNDSNKRKAQQKSFRVSFGSTGKEIYLGSFVLSSYLPKNTFKDLNNPTKLETLFKSPLCVIEEFHDVDVSEIDQLLNPMDDFETDEVVEENSNDPLESIDLGKIA